MDIPQRLHSILQRLLVLQLNSRQNQQTQKRERKGGRKSRQTTHVAAESVAQRVARERHRDAVLVALLVEHGRGVVVVRERRVAEIPSHLRWFLGPGVDIDTPGRVVQDDARAGEVKISV